MDLDIHKPAVARALQLLEHRLEQLIDALAHRPLWIEVENARSEAEARRQACTAYAGIDYAMEDKAGRSPVCLGVIGVHGDIISLAERVNAAKAAFEAVCVPLQKTYTRVPVKGEGGPTTPAATQTPPAVAT